MKKTLLILVLFVITNLNSFAQLPQDSLLLYYPFNGNAMDSSSNNMDGIVYGATLTTDRFGNPNSAYYFDGTNDYILLPNSNQLKPNFPLSFSFWVKPASLNQLKSGFFSTSPDGSNHSGCDINMSSTNNGRINMNMGDYSGTFSPSSRRTKTSQVNISKGIWYHVVGVYNSYTDMELYINAGKVSGTYSGSGGALQYGSIPGNIGRVNSNVYYQGALDDFAYYNKALDSSEVADLFAIRHCNQIIYTYISVTDTLIIDVVLAVQTANITNTIKVYPNPTKDIVYINTGSYTDMSNYTIKITNSLGATIFSNLCNQSQFQINLNTFGGAGVYYLQIFDDQNVLRETKKIILQ